MIDTLQIDTLLVDRGPGETRVAALSGESVVEVYHHRHGVAGAGALYRGRVGKRLPDASAVFVDVGLAQPAFMPCGRVPPVEGATVDVRIVQPARGTKGAKVTEADRALVDAAIDKAHRETAPPVCLAEAEHPIAKCARLYGDSLTRAIVTPNDTDSAIRTFFGSMAHLEFESRSEDIFFTFGVDEVIEQALSPIAPFAGGGKLIIEPTAALVAIDVDAGPMSASQANSTAVDAVAREVRLRALAGPMIVDLIPAKGRSSMVERLKAAVEADPVPTTVSGLTPEGRLEFNRRRVRPSLAEVLLDSSGMQPSVDAVVYQALRQYVRRAMADNMVNATLQCHERVASALRGSLRQAFDEAESRVKCSIALSVMPDCKLSQIDILAA